MTRQERLARVKTRYLQDERGTRLGGLAANLSRVHSFSANIGHRDAVEDLIVESEDFIEWTAADCDAQRMERLSQLQLELACWRRDLNQIWEDGPKRRQMAESARARSQEILSMSGLIGAGDR